MTDFQWGNTLYGSWHRMIEAAAYDWWTGGGLNSPEIIDTFDLQGVGDCIIEAEEMIEGWGLDRPQQSAFTGDDDAPSWMEANNVSHERLAEALLEFWRTRPDRVKEDEL